jgi:hypothetical protein
MYYQDILSRWLSRSGFAALLLALLACLAPGRAGAAPAGVLPLPDLLIYGTVTSSTGDLLEHGTLKVLLNGRTIATTEITEITGTGYTYLLVAPMAMLRPGDSAGPPDMAMVGSMLTFTVNERPLYYQDPVTSLTASHFTVPANGAGSGVVLDLSLPDAMSFPIGDVNANGLRNAADAMLALKYDIGMIAGVTLFPPGPNTVYLPLCDIVANGQCDSGDALRILQCDVGTPGITCPTDRFPGWLRVAQAPMAGAMTRFEVAAIQGDDPTNVDVQVLLASGAAQFGAASLELHYDPALFAPITCSENPQEEFDMVVCNPSFAPGTVRFGVIASAGAVDGAEMIVMSFQRTGAVDGSLGTYFTLTADGVADLEGGDLAWGEAGKDIDTDPGMGSDPAANPETGVESPASATTWLYLPFLNSSAISPVAVTEEPAIEPPMIEFELYLPSVNFGDTAAAGVDEGAFPDEPPVEDAEDTETESTLPLADETPVADKPKEGHGSIAMVIGGMHLYKLNKSCTWQWASKARLACDELGHIQFGCSVRLAGWIAQKRKPVVAAWIDASDLVRALALALASLVGAHVVPEHEQIEVGLQGFLITEILAIIQETLEQAVDALDQAAGTSCAVKDLHQASSQAMTGGVVSDERVQVGLRLGGLRAQQAMAVDQGLTQTPMASHGTLKAFLVVQVRQVLGHSLAKAWESSL